MPRTKVVGWSTRTGPDATVAVQAGRPAEQDLVVVPEPRAHPDQRARLRSDDGADAGQPRTRDRWQQREQHLDEQREPAVPAAHAPSRPWALLASRAGPGDVAGARVDRRLPLIQSQVAVGADVRGKEPVIARAVRAVENENPPERTVEIAVPPTVRRHAHATSGARHAGDRAPGDRVRFASEGRDG